MENPVAAIFAVGAVIISLLYVLSGFDKNPGSVVFKSEGTQTVNVEKQQDRLID